MVNTSVYRFISTHSKLFIKSLKSLMWWLLDKLLWDLIFFTLLFVPTNIECFCTYLIIDILVLRIRLWFNILLLLLLKCLLLNLNLRLLRNRGIQDAWVSTSLRSILNVLRNLHLLWGNLHWRLAMHLLLINIWGHIAVDIALHVLLLRIWLILNVLLLYLICNSDLLLLNRRRYLHFILTHVRRSYMYWRHRLICLVQLLRRLVQVLFLLLLRLVH